MRGVALNLRDCGKSKIAPPTYFLGINTLLPSKDSDIQLGYYLEFLKLVLCRGKEGPLGTISPLRLGSRTSVLTGYVM